jgi:hypothetical protein
VQVGLTDPEKRGSYSDRYNSLTNPLGTDTRSPAGVFRNLCVEPGNFQFAQGRWCGSAKHFGLAAIFQRAGVQPFLGRSFESE